jgi:hypothetical protein
MAKMASQMPKTSKTAAFAPAAMGNGENGVFWPAPALTGKSRPADFQGDGGRCSIWGKARRADIFVAWRSKNESGSVGATSWWPSARTMPPRRGLNLVWVVVLQRCRAYGAAECGDNSPAIYGWGIGRQIYESREGRQNDSFVPDGTWNIPEP